MADQRDSRRRVMAAVVGYVVALIATVAALLVYPFSTPLMLMLFALFGLFVVWTFFVFYHVSSTFWSGRLSSASDPGNLRLSAAKLRQIQPEFVESRGDLRDWFDQLTGTQAASLARLEDHLRLGDSRAAVVLTRTPLLIAAYTDELDCIALLQFPDHLTREYGLKPRSRLLTVNWYTRIGPLAPDLEDGPHSYGRYSNFKPIVADFVTDDVDGLRERKRTISEDEWERAWVLGQRYLVRHGFAARDGRPATSMTPADLSD